jgi:predicted ATPase
MQAELKELGRESAIGITTGWVFCGPIGNQQRREYTLVGNAVNMAARLMQAASNDGPPGEGGSNIYCDQATFDAIQDQANRGKALASNIALKALPPIGVKGKLELVAAYRPNIKRQLRPTPLSRNMKSSPIIGLGGERKLVNDLLQEQSNLSTKKDNTLLVIDGEAGMGKSLLVSDALSIAKSLNFTVLYGAADELDRVSPFLAWQSIFSSIYGVNLLSSDTQSLRSHVLRQLPPIRGEKGFPAYAISLSPLLNSVLPLEFPENRTTLGMSEAIRVKTTHSFLLRLLQRQVNISVSRRKRPLMIVIENGQWLDPASFDLLLACSRLVKPMLIAIATRTVTEPTAGREPNSIWDQVQGLPGSVHLSMPLLTNEQAEALVCQKMGVEEISREAASILIEKTGGHPAHSLELVRSWLNAGIIEVAGAVCSMVGDEAALQSSPIPSSIQKSITARIERLAPQEQLILKVAACLKTEFTSAQLLEVYPLHQSAKLLIDSLDNLVQVDLIRYSLHETNSIYSFSSALVREVSGNLLPSKQRRMLS